MDELIDVISVTPCENWLLDLAFEDGSIGVFDMKPYLDKGFFERLKDPTVFRQARVVAGTVSWPGGVDIAPECLYRGIQGW